MLLKIKRQLMPTASIKSRVKNFREVALGFDKALAQKESQRCLNCKQPLCRKGCPVDIDIRGFIQAVKTGDFINAYYILKQKNNLPGICGRVCPQETQCEAACILSKQDKPVAIGHLERFVADWALNSQEKITDKVKHITNASKKNKKVAVIGSGPAGLTAAADLAKLGFDVTIFESLHAAGGVLRYGIPEFRMPNNILDVEIDFVKKLGVKIELNVLVGKTISIDELKTKGFAAFFIATGAGLPKFLNIPGENLNGVYSANEFLTRINLMKAYRFPEYETPVAVGNEVYVIGGGNVAVDAARAALRLGVKKVTIIYRRSLKEMPARIEEINNAQAEGIKFEFLTTPLRIIGSPKGFVRAIECIKNKLGGQDASGRSEFIPIPGSEFLRKAQTIICAIGQNSNPVLISEINGFQISKKNTIIIDKTMATNIPGIFAGGDITAGSATVIRAMGAGKKAAVSIAEFLSG